MLPQHSVLNGRDCPLPHSHPHAPPSLCSALPLLSCCCCVLLTLLLHSLSSFAFPPLLDSPHPSPSPQTSSPLPPPSSFLISFYLVHLTSIAPQTPDFIRFSFDLNRPPIGIQQEWNRPHTQGISIGFE